MRSFTGITFLVCLVGLQINAQDFYAEGSENAAQIYGGGGHGGNSGHSGHSHGGHGGK